jgi:hypothetical protein
MGEGDVHQVIRQRHHRNDQHVHRDADHDNTRIEPKQRLVLCQSSRDQLAPHEVQKVAVEPEVDDEVQHFFDAVPDDVELDEGVGDF